MAPRTLKHLACCIVSCAAIFGEEPVYDLLLYPSTWVSMKLAPIVFGLSPMYYLIMPFGAVLAVYILYIVVDRLYLSPLAKFPGPKLAGLTSCYEMYYDFVQHASFPWKIEKLHQIYGSIIRITPNELHINDPSYADTQFSSLSKQDKYSAHQAAFSTLESTVNTVGHEHHKIRRGPLAIMFSKRRVTALEPVIAERVDKLCSHLDNHKHSGTAIDLRLLFSCLTTDIITDYAMGESLDLLSNPEFALQWRNAFVLSLSKFHWFKHFPVLWQIMRSLPKAFLSWVSPTSKMMLDFEYIGKQQVRRVMQDSAENITRSTIFYELLRSDLPAQEKSFERLWQEGQAVVGAGTETTAHSLTVIIFLLLTHPGPLARVMEELLQVMPTPYTPINLQRLENLPYLTAVIQEGLRMAVSVTFRLSRISPDQDIQYRGWTIPAGTAVSMSIMGLHYNSQIFPEPHKFIPERWLEGRNTRNELFTFLKGPRMCAGINLAYAELYLTIALVLRRFELFIYETTDKDVFPMRDAFLPMPSDSSKGVRVIVK